MDQSKPAGDEQTEVAEDIGDHLKPEESLDVWPKAPRCEKGQSPHPKRSVSVVMALLEASTVKRTLWVRQSQNNHQSRKGWTRSVTGAGSLRFRVRAGERSGWSCRDLIRR